MNGVRLYFRYIRLHFLSQLQYTLWPMALLTTALLGPGRQAQPGRR